jgi:2-methylcitrate dehydratase PrpD
LGRAAEGGILAATLAQDGFTGPVSVLEGHDGFLRAFCLESEPERLTLGLGQSWETLKICLKRYPCHITAHTPIEAACAMTAEHGFAVEQIDSIVVKGSKKMAALHNIPVPADLIMAQYSIPWCMAAALAGDPRSPASFSQEAFDNPRVAALSARGSVEEGAPADFSSWGAEVHVRLHNGRTLKQSCDNFPGTPERPLTNEEFRDKFLALVGDRSNVESYFQRLICLEKEHNLDWLGDQ